MKKRNIILVIALFASALVLLFFGLSKRWDFSVPTQSEAVTEAPAYSGSVLSSFLFSGFSAMLYSLAGGLLSVTVMSVLFKIGGFSPIVIGMAGGVFHNVGQVGLAMLILETDKLVYYMAVLMLVGLGTGFATGYIAKLLMHRLPAGLRPDSAERPHSRQ